MLPQQYDDRDPLRQHMPTKPNCSFAFRHGCLGACRYQLKGHHLDDNRAAAYVYDDGTQASPIDAHIGLRALLSHVLSDGPLCSLSLAGDSLIHDAWAATVSGAMTLGFQPLHCVCSAGSRLWQENMCPSLPAEPGSCYATFNASVFSVGHTRTNYGSKACTTFSIRYHQLVTGKSNYMALPLHHRRQDTPAQIMSASSVVIHNAGSTHSNIGSEGQQILDRFFLPILQIMSDNSQQSGRLLYLESLPQHFASSDGSGLYDRGYLKRFKPTSCLPIRNASAALWRNTFFHDWIRRRQAEDVDSVTASTYASALHPLWLEVPLFDAFVPRHDMHTAQDCTHYCYSPFLYAPLWNNAATELSRARGENEKLDGHHLRHEAASTTPPDASSPIHRVDHFQGYCTLANLTGSMPHGSIALHRYLDLVYGVPCKHEEREARRSWSWSDVEFVWIPHLPAALQECKWPTKSNGIGSVHHTAYTTKQAWGFQAGLWANGPRSHGEDSNWGGGRVAPLIKDSEWVEVMHRTHVRSHGHARSRGLEAQMLWLYHANGSGLWYRTGRTFSVNDLQDVTEWLNRTDSVAYGRLYWKDEVLRTAMDVLSKQGFETLEFRRHVDQQERSAYKHELVGLRGYPLLPGHEEACPPDPTMRWGWRAGQLGCECDESVTPRREERVVRCITNASCTSRTAPVVPV